MTFLDVYSILIPILTLLALLYAAVQDMLFREVRHEFVWLSMVGAGFVLDILYLIFYDGARAFSDVLAEMLLNIVLGFLLGFLLFYIGAWGGADSKALWSLAVLVPLHPFLERIPFLFLPDSPLLIIDSSVVSILLNSALFALFYPLILLLYNSIHALRSPPFLGVQGSFFDKARCFLFGYQKAVHKITPKKLHFDFLEALPDRSFTGRFSGDFSGRLDGSFLGFFEGSLKGDFAGRIVGKVLSGTTPHTFADEDVNAIIAEAQSIFQHLKLEKKDNEEDLDYALRKYQTDLFGRDRSVDIVEGEKLIISEGQSFGAFSGLFIGFLEGVFDGSFEGRLLGKLTGDFHGSSSKGKLTGTQTGEPTWKLKMRFGLEDESLMEKRQLRTLWQLQTRNKKTVWVTPGIPFVFLMLLGFLLYLFFGNFLLFLFRLA